MELSVISFTEKGKLLSEKMADLLADDAEIKVSLFTKCKAYRNESIPSAVSYVESPIGEWAGERMQKENALLFIGACGIAVRAIAPHITDKLHDVPVLVMDEKGNYVIPVLSGHMGGANELALYLAKKTGAGPVITTATDINQKFAVDLFAKRNHFFITDKEGIARVSSKALAGKVITMSIEPGHVMEEFFPETEGVRLVPYPPAKAVDVVVSSGEAESDCLIWLRPRDYVIGIGCKKGKDEAELEELIARKTAEHGICVSQIFALASITQKRDEPGLVGWCRKEGVPFLTYTAEELQAVKGKFTESDFVKQQVGVDNVCERAAVKACGENGKLVMSKYAENGMTIAIAKRSR